VPADFHSMNIATTYYNFERANDLFGRVASLGPGDMPTPPVYYFADFTEQGQQESDNAMFVALLEGFVILPFETYQQVPMAINGGIIGHEYTHSVFNKLVFDAEPIPQVYQEWDQLGLLATPGLNLIKSLDEGIADVFGTGATCTDDFSVCDTAFIGDSLPGTYLDDRRVDLPHCMTPSLHDSMNSLTLQDFGNLIYEVGSVFSSAMWRASEDAALVSKQAEPGDAKKLMFQALYNSLGTRGGVSSLHDLAKDSISNQTHFALASTSTTKGVLDTVVDAAGDPDLQVALCSAFMDRFDLTLSDLTSCPATAKSYGDCKR
jgi:hypothetical protein